MVPGITKICWLSDISSLNARHMLDPANPRRAKLRVVNFACIFQQVLGLQRTRRYKLRVVARDSKMALASKTQIHWAPRIHRPCGERYQQLRQRPAVIGKVTCGECVATTPVPWVLPCRKLRLRCKILKLHGKITPQHHDSSFSLS